MKKQKKERTGANDIFFSHDANAASDPNMLKLLFRYGFQGYGYFWRICEAMRREEDQNFSLCFKDDSSIEAIAAMLVTQKEVVDFKYLKTYLTDCATDFGLFQIKGGRIYSASLRRRMERMLLEREKKSQGGKVSAQRRRDAVDLPKNDSSILQDSSKIVSTEVNKPKPKPKPKLKLKLKADLSLINISTDLTFDQIHEEVFDGIESICNDVRSHDTNIVRAWCGFMKLRHFKKWWVTHRAAEALWRELWMLAGNDIDKACAIIQQSEVKVWRSFFKLADQNNFTNKTNGSITDKYKAIEDDINRSN